MKKLITILTIFVTLTSCTKEDEFNRATSSTYQTETTDTATTGQPEAVFVKDTVKMIMYMVNSAEVNGVNYYAYYFKFNKKLSANCYITIDWTIKTPSTSTPVRQTFLANPNLIEQYVITNIPTGVAVGALGTIMFPEISGFRSKYTVLEYSGRYW